MDKKAGIVQIDFARRSLGFKRLDDLQLALIERLLAGFPDVEVDQLLIIRNITQTLKFKIPQARAVSTPRRMAFSSGECENFTYTRVPPRKSTPHGMWCQNRMENKPATLKISEKARKYHFFPRKSMLVLRKNSKSKPQVCKGFRVSRSKLQGQHVRTAKP